MFTIKFYSDDGFRTRIMSAESFTVLRDAGGAEITLHQRNGAEDCRIDIAAGEPEPGWPRRYAKAIIENAAGRTTEIIHQMPATN